MRADKSSLGQNFIQNALEMLIVRRLRHVINIEFDKRSS
jgi:hypothetical protein